jgi:AcrR family transcriptional regulator
MIVYYLVFIFEGGNPMSDKMDRRQQRTKQLLRKTLFELMEEKTIESITVTDISNRADINRGTFYLHFRDVSDMMEQIKEEMFEKIRRVVIQIDLRELLVYSSKGETYPILVKIFEELVRNSDFFKAIFGPNGDMSFVRRLKEFMSSIIFNKLTYLQPQEENLLVPRDFIIAYMASANIGVVLHWIESGMKLSPLEMGQIMTQLVSHGPLVSTGMIKV